MTVTPVSTVPYIVMLPGEGADASAPGCAHPAQYSAALAATNSTSNILGTANLNTSMEDDTGNSSAAGGFSALT